MKTIAYVLASLFVMASGWGSTPALAGAARCGDLRKIERSAGGFYPLPVCYDRSQSTRQIQELKVVARDRALERLQKFDRECSELGGRIETRNEDLSGLVRITPRQGGICFPIDSRGCPWLEDCQIYGWAEITHACVCE